MTTATRRAKPTGTISWKLCGNNYSLNCNDIEDVVPMEFEEYWQVYDSRGKRYEILFSEGSNALHKKLSGLYYWRWGYRFSPR